jgi:uncharacterized protein (TIGR00725 family)
LPIVGVIGSGSEEHQDRANLLGSWLATKGVHLLTGAGQGVMAAVSRAFAQTPNRQGLVLGVVPCVSEDRPDVPKVGYPNEWVEVPIFTHLPFSGQRGTDLRSRNHLVVLTASVVVALPGGLGTASEVQLAVRYKRPVIGFLRGWEEIEGLPERVRWEPDFERVKAFVSEVLAKGQ